jgi:alkaline phosphatase
MLYEFCWTGLFSPAHMEYFLESSAANNPTLEEMTRKAIQMLQKETNGYVLLVEGLSQIHHNKCSFFSNIKFIYVYFRRKD